jgi:hypothetical protein
MSRDQVLHPYKTAGKITVLLRRGAGKSQLFLFPVFLFAAQPTYFFG